LSQPAGIEEDLGRIQLATHGTASQTSTQETAGSCASCAATGGCRSAGLAVFALLPAEGLPVPRFFFAWDASVILCIGLIYWMIYHSADHIGSAPPIRTKGKRLF